MIQMDDKEIEEIRKELKGLMDKKMGSRKYIVSISYDSSEKDGKGQVTSSTFQNVDYDKDGFNMVKALLIALEQGTSQHVRKVMGVRPLEEVRPTQGPQYG